MELIRGEGLCKQFRGVLALSDVGIAVNDHEILGIIGPNGAGKTTLFNVLAGAVRPDAGRVTFAGRDVTRWPSHRRRRAGIARTFQLVHPFGSLTVRQNLVVGATGAGHSPRAAHAAVDETLVRFGLTRLAQREASSLNAAEGRRLEVARALVVRPRLMLLDEIFTGLNNEEVADLAAVVRLLPSDGLGVLVIEHNVSAIRMVADRVLAMDSGTVICAGDPASVFADANVVRSYLGSRTVDA